MSAVQTLSYVSYRESWKDQPQMKCSLQRCWLLCFAYQQYFPVDCEFPYEGFVCDEFSGNWRNVSRFPAFSTSCCVSPPLRSESQVQSGNQPPDAGSGWFPQSSVSRRDKSGSGLEQTTCSCKLVLVLDSANHFLSSLEMKVCGGEDKRHQSACFSNLFYFKAC